MYLFPNLVGCVYSAYSISASVQLENIFEKMYQDTTAPVQPPVTDVNLFWHLLLFDYNFPLLIQFQDVLYIHFMVINIKNNNGSIFLNSIVYIRNERYRINALLYRERYTNLNEKTKRTNSNKRQQTELEEPTMQDVTLIRFSRQCREVAL